MPVGGAVALYLLFAPGSRPSRDAVREVSLSSGNVTVSYDPAVPHGLHIVEPEADSASIASGIDDPTERISWLELLCDGLAFDVHGLAPGDALDLPRYENRFDLPSERSVSRLEAIRITPGEHLLGGGASMPVMRSLFALARDLVKFFDGVEVAAWGPSRSLMGAKYFDSIVTSWLEGGPFPALGLTSFRETADGALQSEGLDFWINQELRIEQPISADKIEATRLGVRLINHLILVGGIDTAERVTAPDRSRMVLRPSRNGKFVRVAHE